jgi:hypothetical protein
MTWSGNSHPPQISMLTSPKPVLPAANADDFSPSKLHTSLRRRYSPLSIQTILPGSRQRWTKAADRVRDNILQRTDRKLSPLGQMKFSIYKNAWQLLLHREGSYAEHDNMSLEEEKRYTGLI